MRRSEGQLEGSKGQLEESKGQPAGSEGQTEGDGRMDGQNFFSFYGTLSPVGAAAQRLKKKDVEETESNFERSDMDVMPVLRCVHCISISHHVCWS